MKTKRGKIKALIFDMGGVLAGANHHGKIEPVSDDIHVQISKALGIGLDTWIDAIDSSYAKSIEGKLSPGKTKSIISKNLHIPSQTLEKKVLQVYKKLFSQNKKLYDYAIRKKREGYKIAILSDQWPFSKKALFLPNLMKKFDAVVVSCDVGMRKPNPKIYRLTTNKLKIKPKEAIFIDNREWNLKPAKKLGMKTVLFRNNRQTIKDIENILG